jgi:hypothetical protein
MEIASVKTTYIDEACNFFHLLHVTAEKRAQDREMEASRAQILYGMSLRATLTDEDADEDDVQGTEFGVREVEHGNRVR